MCKYYPALAALCGMVLCVGMAQAVPYDQNIYLFHEGSNDPTTESNLWTFNPGSNPAVVSKGPGTETIGGSTYDYWYTADNGTAASETLNYSETISAAQALNPWTLRGRIRSVGTTATDQFIALYDGTNVPV